MMSIDEGRVINASDEQFENAETPRTEMPQPRSNVTTTSFSHFEKQNREIFSIDEGIQIDRSDGQFANANSPRIVI
jgi:hypothetical protein